MSWSTVKPEYGAPLERVSGNSYNLIYIPEIIEYITIFVNYRYLRYRKIKWKN
jgi:hypothetical protein